MRLGYIVSAYKNPLQLARLVRRLHTGDESHFAIHVDRKSSAETYETIQAGLAGLANVTFLERHACHWGGFGHVAASLKGIRHLRESGSSPDYVILLSGQDYPIKSNASLRDFLEQGNERSFFMHFPLPTRNWTSGGLDRFRRWHWRYRRLHVRLPLRRRLPDGMRPWGGSAYWILSRAALETVGAFVDGNPEYVRFFRHVDIPDELFFQTILLNSEETERCVDFRLHHTEWSRLPAPAILTMEDYPRLTSSACLFARKFDDSVDEQVLDRIDRELLA